MLLFCHTAEQAELIFFNCLLLTVALKFALGTVSVQSSADPSPQIDNYGGAHGIRDKGLLESAVFRPQTGYCNTIAKEAAALIEPLANNHPFLDGNKCVAFAWLAARRITSNCIPHDAAIPCYYCQMEQE